MLTRRAKAYSSYGLVVTHRSTNRARRRVTSFQSKRVTNYATPPTPVPWRHLVNDIDLRSPKSLKSLTPAWAGLHEPRGSELRLLKSTFNAENFIRRLSWSNSSHFVAIQYWNNTICIWNFQHSTSVPRVRTTFASRGFSIAAPTVWNSLPSSIRSSTSTFRRLLKTHCFQQAYCSP